MDERYFELFDKCRNLIPIMSIEGEKELTDARRGKSIYDRLISNMDELHRCNLIFGASITVTVQNIREVTSDIFLKKLSNRGRKAVIFVEFVPVTDNSKELAPGEAEREYLRDEMASPREEYPEMRKAQADAWQQAAVSSISIPTMEQNRARSHPILM